MKCRRTSLRLRQQCARFVFALVIFAVPMTKVACGDTPATGACEVLNLGHGGDTTADLLARLEQDVLGRAPSLVVLLVGTNDLLNSKKAVSLPQYRENLSALVARIHTRGARVVLSTLPPAYAPYLSKRQPAEFYGAGGPGAHIAAGNAAIREVAREHNVALV